MTAVETALVTLFAVLVGAVAWWTWSQREQARRQAAMSAELAAMGREVRGIAHDVGNLFQVVLGNLEAAKGARPDELPEILDDVERAARGAELLARALRGGGAPDPTVAASCEGLVRLSVALLRRGPAPVRLEVTGDLPFRGDEIDVLRLVQNLLMNAMREAARIPGSCVAVALADGALRVSNPVRDRAALADRLAREGTSGEGSTGLGLGIARQAAARLDWSIRHEIGESSVAFVVERAAAPDR